MPHFIIECSENVLEISSAENIMETVYSVAESSGLFAKGDIKVRIAPYSLYKLAEGKHHFLHVFAYIMEGRTQEQKKVLSERIIEQLNLLLPELSVLSMNISDFELIGYCNKSLIGSANSSQNRHYGL